MKYHCINCNKDFNELDKNKKISSSLVRITLLVCPFCGNSNVVLSEIGKLLIERREKIKTIESNESTGII